MKSALNQSKYLLVCLSIQPAALQIIDVTNITKPSKNSKSPVRNTPSTPPDTAMRMIPKTKERITIKLRILLVWLINKVSHPL